jgi:hypothetical protein
MRSLHVFGDQPSHWRQVKLAFLLALIACGSTEPKSTRLHFEGTVTDAVTGAPIPGANLGVVVGTLSVGLPILPLAADSEGHYTISSGCIHNPWLEAYSPGYHWFSLKVECKEEIQTVNIQLARDPTAP